MNTIFSQALFIAQGLKVSFAILLGGLGIGVSLGTLFSILRYNRIGTFLIDFIIPQVFGIRFDVLSTGILTFGLNSSAYVSEIIRAGIESVPRGQFEAAMTLQISHFYMWKDIILPQVVKNVLPALANEVISLLKESALISTIGGMDIMKKVNIITAQQMSYFTPLCIAGLYYYGLVMLITMLSSYFETKDHHA